MPNRATIPALALATLSLSACGSSSSQTSGSSKSSTPAAPSLSAFKAGFAHDKAQFTKLGNELGLAIRTASKKTNSQLGAEFNTLASRATQQQTKLGKLNPPARYKAKVDELIADFGAVGKDMKAIATASSTNDAAAARSSATRLVKHSAALKTVDVALTAALGLPQTP